MAMAIKQCATARRLLAWDSLLLPGHDRVNIENPLISRL